MKKEKLKEMLRDLQYDDDFRRFSEFSEFCEDFLFKAIQKGYLTSEGKKQLEYEIKSCFKSKENKIKYEIE